MNFALMHGHFRIILLGVVNTTSSTIDLKWNTTWQLHGGQWQIGVFDLFLREWVRNNFRARSRARTHERNVEANKKSNGTGNFAIIGLISGGQSHLMTSVIFRLPRRSPRELVFCFPPEVTAARFLRALWKELFLSERCSVFMFKTGSGSVQKLIIHNFLNSNM